jgi:hypothetical protein
MERMMLLCGLFGVHTKLTVVANNGLAKQFMVTFISSASVNRTVCVLLAEVSKGLGTMPLAVKPMLTKVPNRNDTTATHTMIRICFLIIPTLQELSDSFAYNDLRGIRERG